ncbi:MAG: D-alanine--D-alanine ligase [bacterium]|nr:D-alanine--D-alanine ligase [bacterium]
MNIVVLLGGISPERNISLLSGRAATHALRAKGHTVATIDPARGVRGVMTDAELAAVNANPVTDAELAAFRTEQLVECIHSPLFDGVDIVFMGLHGRYGEDGYVQALLDLRGIPYTGSGMLSSAMCMDKTVSKMMFQISGIPTPHWVSVTPEQADDLEILAEVQRELRGPVVVKPNDQGSTVGMSVIETGVVEDLAKAVRLAAKFSSSILVERYIPGRELTVAVLGGEALPIIEIEPKAGFYDYANKYTKGCTEYHCPADLSEEVMNHVQELAVTAHAVLGCRAYSRIDFRLTEEHMPFCLEVNTLPGFTETSLVPMAARQAGIEFGDLCEEIIRLSGNQ